LPAGEAGIFSIVAAHQNGEIVMIPGMDSPPIVVRAAPATYLYGSSTYSRRLGMNGLSVIPSANGARSIICAVGYNIPGHVKLWVSFSADGGQTWSGNYELLGDSLLSPSTYVTPVFNDGTDFYVMGGDGTWGLCKFDMSTITIDAEIDTDPSTLEPPEEAS